MDKAANETLTAALTVSLLPPNSTAQERGIESSVSSIETVELSIAEQWRPQTCPAALLPWLAWSLSIDEWDEQWSEQTKRDMIKQAAAVHKVKGTVGSVKRALAALGVTLEFIEWFEQPQDLALAPIHSSTPHTFVFIAWVNAQAYSSQPVVLDQTLYDAIYRVTNKVKPARSHFDFLVGAKINAGMTVGNASTGWLQSRRLSNETKAVQIPKSDNQLTLGSTAGGWLQSTRLSNETKAVQIPKSDNQLTLGSTTGGWLQSARLTNQTQAVQMAKMNSALSVHLYLSNKRYAVARFYLRNKVSEALY